MSACIERQDLTARLQPWGLDISYGSPGALLGRRAWAGTAGDLGRGELRAVAIPLEVRDHHPVEGPKARSLRTISVRGRRATADTPSEGPSLAAPTRVREALGVGLREEECQPSATRAS